VTPIEVIDQALAVARSRLSSAPGFEVFISTVAQLEYLAAVLRGDENDRSRLKSINVGHFAVREFEESDPELADALFAAQAIASKMAKGLKV
jgi:predicted nucleic acid-binding protein